MLIEFAAAYVHQLLYARGVYSKELFKRHRLYGTVAWKSRHPELNTYIAQATSSLQVRNCQTNGWRNFEGPFSGVLKSLSGLRRRHS